MNTPSDTHAGADSTGVRLLTLDQVAAKLQVSKKTVTRLWKDEDRAVLRFPKPKVHICRSPRWLESEVDAWILADHDDAERRSEAEHVGPIRTPISVARAG